MPDHLSSLVRQIDRVKTEISELRKSLLEREAFLNGLEEAHKLVSKAKPTGLPQQANAASLTANRAVEGDSNGPRRGTDLAKAMDLIRAAGRPMRLQELLEGMGKENTKANRVSLTGTLGGYVRQQKWFTRPEPNTFSLIDLPVTTAQEEEEDLKIM